ncbi:MAG TPA: SRPBCC domain-containing protein [Pedobacter sp.]|jgi:hypothetical protein
MKFKKIQKSITISSAKSAVWNVLLKDNYTRIWYAEFCEGTHAITDWEEGSKAIFMDNSKQGIVGKVIAHKYGELLTLEYDGVVSNGVEDYESNGAQAVKGSGEKYELTGKDGSLVLNIECDMADQYFEMMSLAWDNALEKIKILSEKN